MNKMLINNRYQLIAGLEIETAFNNRVLGDLELNDYHDSDIQSYSDYFFLEADSSLYSSSHLGVRYPCVVEIISDPFKVEDLDVILKDFKKRTQEGLVKDKELIDYFHFNNSCGGHIHLSLVDTQKEGMETIIARPEAERELEIQGQFIDPQTWFSTEFLLKFRKVLHKRIKEELPKVYPFFREQYIRNYAKRFTNHAQYSRSMEFNFTTGRKEFEFRAFNLRGVRTWDAFFTMYKIVFSVLTKCLEKELNKSKPFCNTKTLKGEIPVSNEVKVNKLEVKLDIVHNLKNEETGTDINNLPVEEIYKLLVKEYE